MKKSLFIVLFCLLITISGCSTQYKRISFSNESLGLELAEHIDTNTKVIDNITKEITITEFPVYEISKRDVSKEDFRKMLENLNLNINSGLTLNGNEISGSLADYTDPSRGYFNMTDKELEKLAWEVLEKMPFIEGTYEYCGIKSTYTIIDAEGEHITRAGVSFRRTIDNARILGNDQCYLYFDGSGLVEVFIALYDYKKIDTLDLIPVDVAFSSIQSPDSFIIHDDNKVEKLDVIDTIQVEKNEIIFYNQDSRGCTILQPVYNFIGTAIDDNNSSVKIELRIIAIPEKYTYE